MFLDDLDLQVTTVTKAQHDRMVAARGAPLTDETTIRPHQSPSEANVSYPGTHRPGGRKLT